MASQIEILNRRRHELSKKLKFLENDPNYEQLKQNLKIEAKLNHLDEKIKILQESRSESVELFEEINKTFESLEKAIETPKFLEKFEVSKSIIEDLLKNPDKKPEDLKAADFTQNPELQKSEIWKNILEDAKEGLLVAKVLIDKKLDEEDPKSYFEKAGDTGKKILDQIDKNPVLVAGLLIAGTYALYQFLKKDSGIWDKFKGTMAAGIGTWLGFSVAESNLPQKGAEKLAAGLLGQKNVDFVKNLFGWDNPNENKDGPDENKDQPGENTRASEVAANTLEYFKEKMPLTAAAISEFNENLFTFPPNLSESKKSFNKIYENLNKEKGQAVIEFSKDGAVNLAILGYKGVEKTVVFTWTATPKLINTFGDWLMQPEQPWLTQAGGLFVKADAWLAGIGATAGVTKSIFEMTYKKESWGIIKTPWHLAKGAFKGATVGQFTLVKNIKDVGKYRNSMISAYGKMTKIRSLNFAEKAFKMPFDGIKNIRNNPKHFIKIIEHEIIKAEYYKSIAADFSMWNKDASKRFSDLHEAAYRRAQGGIVGTRQELTKLAQDGKLVGKSLFRKLNKLDKQAKGAANLSKTPVLKLISRHAIALENIHAKHSIRVLKIQKNAENLQGMIKKALKKNPGMKLEEFFKTSEGLKLRNQLNAVNNSIEKATKKYTESVAKTLSGGKISEIEKLPKELQKKAARFITKQAGKETRLSNRLIGKFLTKNVGGRLIIMAPLIAIRAYAHSDQETALGAAGSAALHMIPLIGTSADFYSAFSGKDIVTGAEVSRLSSLGWGIMGIGLDVLVLVGGVGAGARIVLRGAKNAVKIKAVVKAAKASKTVRNIKWGTIGTGAVVAGSTMTHEFFTAPKEVASILID